MSESALHPPVDLAKHHQGQVQTLTKKGPLYRLLRNPALMPYHRLAVLVFAMNVFAFLQLAESVSFIHHQIPLPWLLYLTLANFGVGIFIRQQQVINLLFKMATSAPKSWPLSIRWALGKVYQFGGIHVGGYFSGTLWLTLFLFTATWGPESSFIVPSAVKVLGFFHLCVLLCVMYVALPHYRMVKHNSFEVISRFGNWLSLGLFWCQALVLIYANCGTESYIFSVFSAPEVYALAYLTFCVARPWLRLKKIPVDTVTPSNHVAISQFDYGVTPFAGSSTDLSRNPLLEWHSFANIPAPQKTGFRLCISRAGDWTGQYIDEKPKHLWVKGVPAAGVGNIERLFKKVIWIATGSGVGPCLPHLLVQKVPSQLIWSTRSPRDTYGDELVDEILTAQPEALILDTTTRGRPDLVSLALEAYRNFEAEAVIVISNKKVTFHVNYELESRGIPSFGAIWDS